jgi:hypothetical protein
MKELKDYESYKNKIKLLEEADQLADIALAKKRKQDAWRSKVASKKRERERKEQQGQENFERIQKYKSNKSEEYAKRFAGFGAIIGGLGGFVSCIQTINNSYSAGLEVLLYPIIGIGIGTLFFAIIGAVYGQMKNP